ncbi:RecT family recombinase [Achromobacter arsenitoxydans]|uniref:Putative entero exodeoxyribonuclease VIII n=1 Tax=Achromobacter arsenitoxydans SY8 TaxID=477184 RepID=H0F743_9BURK|nr:RecT family recombinase [Achromobacter arsenitoxydans]EHK65957.1 putative entero exodeoxyribonuclease VIII [Achromobacter arsenitoxydans SY8]
MSEATTIESQSTALDLPAANTTTSGLVLHADNMDSMMRAAELMAAGKATVPKHLQGSPSDCMAVIMQAMQWNMNPFVVAQKTHLVNGQLGYEAQLVNAVVQSSGAITGRFHYEYTGDGNGLACRVGAVIAGETDITWSEWLKVSDVTTKNSPLWKTNPRQQMGYLQVKNWTRAYTPGALLGVYTSDELIEAQPRERDITPRTAAEFAQAAKPQPAAQVDRDQLIRDMEMIARSNDAAPQRIADLEAAWKKLTKDERAAVGADEIKRLKSLAAAEDATPAPAAQQDDLPTEDNPFDGVEE